MTLPFYCFTKSLLNYRQALIVSSVVRLLDEMMPVKPLAGRNTDISPSCVFDCHLLTKVTPLSLLEEPFGMAETELRQMPVFIRYSSDGLTVFACKRSASIVLCVSRLWSLFIPRVLYSCVSCSYAFAVPNEDTYIHHSLWLVLWCLGFSRFSCKCFCPSPVNRDHRVNIVSASGNLCFGCCSS